MAVKVALINMKGGVGKSTLAANLAWEMATEPWHKRVLVIDVDPQFNCSQYLVGATTMEDLIRNNRPTIWDIFEQLTAVPGRPTNLLDPADAVVHVFSSARWGGAIDLVPSRLELSQTLRNPSGKEHLLNNAVEQLESNYDIVVMDCAPTDSILTTAVYLTADHILIPVRPEFLSTIGLPLLEQSLNDFRARYQTQRPEVLGIVFNATSDYAPEETISKAEVRQAAQQVKWPVFDAQLKYSKSFPKSSREGVPIFWTSYARTVVKGNFHQFATEFASKVSI